MSTSVSRLVDALKCDHLSNVIVVLAGAGELITSFITSPIALQTRGASRSSARTTVVVYDESKPHTAQCTLWGTKTKWVHSEETADAQPAPASAVGFSMPMKRGDIVLLTSLAAREFRGERRLSTTSSSSIVVLGRGGVWWRSSRDADGKNVGGSLDDFRGCARGSGFAHFRGLFDSLCVGEAGSDVMNSAMRACKNSSWNISTQAHVRSQTPTARGFTAVASLGESLNEGASTSKLVIISERWRIVAGECPGAGAGAGDGDGEGDLVAACLCVYFPADNLYVDNCGAAARGASIANSKSYVPPAATQLSPEHWRERLLHVVCGKCEAPMCKDSDGYFKCTPCALSVKTAFERTSQVVTEGATCRWAIKTAWALLQARTVEWDAAIGVEGDSDRGADAAPSECKWVRLTAPMLVSLLAGMDADYFLDRFEARGSANVCGQQAQTSSALMTEKPVPVETIATDLLRALVSGRDELTWTVMLREE